jgi:hypothetical protein
VVSHEDLITSDLTVQRIEQHLSIEIDAVVLCCKVGSFGRFGEAQVNCLERALLRRAVSPGLLARLLLPGALICRCPARGRDPGRGLHPETNAPVGCWRSPLGRRDL